MYIFLDESGDLGFDFTKPGTSRYFVITVVVYQNHNTIHAINSTIKRTIKHKLNFNKKNKFNELKGTQTPFGVKSYLYNKIKKIDDWKIHSLVVDKQNFNIPSYIKNSNDLYNLFAGMLISKIPLIARSISMVIDKSKTTTEILKFNQLIEGIVFHHSDGTSRILVSHKESHDEKSLQAVDLFCHGIYRRYEKNENQWYSLFKSRLATEIFI